MSHLIVISGPTASGKTSLSLQIAKQFQAEIISADARQFYRGMNIGTAKVSLEEQNEVKHHFIDHLDPDENYSAGQFEDEALAFLDAYFKKNNVAVLVGGSGLYVNAVVHGFDDLPRTKTSTREKWNSIFESHGLEHLQQKLEEVDPDYHQQVDLQNRMRVQRALECVDDTGSKYSELRIGRLKSRSFQVHRLAILPPREELYLRINNRVDEMMDRGLEKEVESLEKWKNCNALQTVGYKEIFDHLADTMTRDEAISKIKQHTRNYAKRQYTLFRKQADYEVFESNSLEPILRHLNQRLNV